MTKNRIRALIAKVMPAVVHAHCDTADGPAVTDGWRALESGNVNHALKWIPADGEVELRQMFDKAQQIRPLGEEVAALADQLFLETLVRLHRLAEGVGFTGIQPSGTAIDPVVVAADAALTSGSTADLLPLVPEERRAELDRRFRTALALGEFDVDDVDAGRRYLAAYVDFFKYAEGEDHEHHGHDQLAHSGHGNTCGH